MNYAIALAFSVSMLPCVTGQAAQSQYPASWWQEVPRSEAASWEILPQDASEGEVILSKRTELGVFSNFAATPITLNNERYASVEGFWQMMKFPEGPEDERAKFPGLAWAHTREQIAAMTAFEAKAAGDQGSANMKKMNINWVTYHGEKLPYRIPEKGKHYDLIVSAMRAKLEQTAGLKELLLSTGDLILKPDHDQGANPPPAWRYFEIWMMLRQELQAKTPR